MNDTTLAYAAILSLSYLIGSIPFGLVLGPLFKAGDIRNIGSGNIGATNALRTGKKLYALLVLLCDGAKGAVAIAVVHCLFGDAYPHAALMAGIAAIVGHLFPVWLKFKGGKGVATGLGVLAALHWPTGLCVALMWLLTARLSRYSSLAAILAFLQAPIYALATDAPEFSLPFAVIAALIIFTHRANLQRLLKGEESMISLGKSA
jgi:glycerol-3-phosphate acyltransferase PlsY